MTFNPDEVTALIWLTPTKAWRRGDPSARAGGPPRRFSGWQYELPEASTFDTEEIVAALLDAIEPYAAARLSVPRAILRVPDPNRQARAHRTITSTRVSTTMMMP
jgi:hypothetical protein